MFSYCYHHKFPFITTLLKTVVCAVLFLSFSRKVCVEMKLNVFFIIFTFLCWYRAIQTLCCRLSPTSARFSHHKQLVSDVFPLVCSLLLPLLLLSPLPSPSSPTLQTMHAHAQFCMSGDYTLEGTDASIKELVREEADEHFVVVLSDANLERYGIRPERFAQVLTSDPQVNAFAIFIGSLGDQAER